MRSTLAVLSDSDGRLDTSGSASAMDIVMVLAVGDSECGVDCGGVAGSESV